MFSTSVEQYRTTRPTDLPYGEKRPLAVRWRKAQYRCQKAHCPRQAFTESIAELPPRARVSNRLRRHAARIGTGRSVAAVVGELPISWPTAHEAFVAAATTLLREPAPPSVLGIDETRRGRPRWRRDDSGGWVKLERFETNFVELADGGGLLGQASGRTGAAVVAWLAARGEAWKAAVHVVAMDPAGYRGAVERALPHARIVVDHFHLVRLGNQMVTEVRQRVVRTQHRRRGRRATRPGHTGGYCCAPKSG